MFLADCSAVSHLIPTRHGRGVFAQEEEEGDSDTRPRGNDLLWNHDYGRRNHGGNRVPRNSNRILGNAFWLERPPSKVLDEKGGHTLASGRVLPRYAHFTVVKRRGDNNRPSRIGGSRPGGIVNKIEEN